MRFKTILVASLVAVSVCFARSARAEQARDWMVGPQPGGTHLNLDVVFPGVQAQLEHRVPIYGFANELTLKVNALPTLVFFESQADVDIRLVVLFLGASIGVREVFHALEFQPSQPFDAQARRDVEFGGNYRKSFSLFGEVRGQLAFPFNDNVLFLSINGLRFEGGRDRVFDWRMGIMRDSGTVFRSDNVLFLKHRSFGALGPRVMVMNYDLDGNNNTQVVYGFSFATRPGFRSRNDILFLSALFGFGGTVNGVDSGDVYGNHLFKVPMTLELAYRTVIELDHPAKPGEIEDEDLARR